MQLKSSLLLSITKRLWFDLVTCMKSFANSLSLSINLAAEMKLRRVKGCGGGGGRTANIAEDHGKRARGAALGARMGLLTQTC